MFFSNNSIARPSLIGKDSSSIKGKNRIGVKFGFVGAFAKEKELHYLHVKEHADDVYYDLKVNYTDQIYFPQVAVNYEYLLNKKNRSPYKSFLSFALGYSKVIIKTTQYGIHYGGFAQAFFEGKIQDERRYHFMTLALGYSFEKKGINKLTYSISPYLASNFNFLNRVIVQEDGLRNNNLISTKVDYKYSQNIYANVRNAFKNLYPIQTAFLIELGMQISVTKQIKKINCGPFLGYMMTNYSFSNRTYSIFDYSFLKNYSLIKTGFTIKF